MKKEHGRYLDALRKQKKKKSYVWILDHDRSRKLGDFLEIIYEITSLQKNKVKRREWFASSVQDFSYSGHDLIFSYGILMKQDALSNCSHFSSGGNAS